MLICERSKPRVPLFVEKKSEKRCSKLTRMMDKDEARRKA